MARMIRSLNDLKKVHKETVPFLGLSYNGIRKFSLPISLLFVDDSLHLSI